MSAISFTDSHVLGKFNGEQRTGMGADFQRETVARLTTFCERLIRDAKLNAQDELNLRTFVNLTCNAFDMAPVQDSFRYKTAHGYMKADSMSNTRKRIATW